ncbi:hypothetical protein [Xanthomonas graminis]|nr:hypothetical protein [Xanthomonas translucens]UKE65600.1 hypothetical protein KM547_18435 [Xanthomonas translucens pv. phlei]UKE73109.1 hypothetical protein KFS85_19170 [Xanthomonas translucens pv. phleipratensis]
MSVGAAVYRDAERNVERYLLTTLPPPYAPLRERVRATIERGERSGRT